MIEKLKANTGLTELSRKALGMFFFPLSEYFSVENLLENSPAEFLTSERYRSNLLSKEGNGKKAYFSYDKRPLGIRVEYKTQCKQNNEKSVFHYTDSNLRSLKNYWGECGYVFYRDDIDIYEVSKYTCSNKSSFMYRNFKQTSVTLFASYYKII